MKKLVTSAAAAMGLALICLSTAAPALAAAATPNAPAAPGTGQALEIAPPLIDLTVNPGQTVRTQIKLRDIAKTNLIVTNEINDFVAADESGTPKILTGDDSNNPFSLKNWITPVPSFQLAPQKIQTVNVTVSVPANAAPGGHYGVIRFTGTAPQVSGSGVGLSASLGALVLLTVNGNLVHKMSVQEFSVNNGGKAGSLFESAPLTFVVRLKNTGNIQEEPAGHVIVTDMFGKTVGGININVPPHNVLPDSIRKFTATLDKTIIGNRRLFGHYTAALTVSYGGSKQTVLTSHIGFWVIPYKLVLAIIIVLIGGFFGLRYLIRWYNKRIIAKVQKSQSQNKSKNKKK